MLAAEAGGARWEVEITPATPCAGWPVRFALRVPEGRAAPTEAGLWVVDRTRPPGEPPIY